MLTVEQIKARATSPREALLVSIEEWTWRAQASEEELRNVAMNASRCGLCYYYDSCHKGEHGLCLLAQGDIVHPKCAEEYGVAQNIWATWKINKVGLAKVRAAFWQMVSRLDSELAKLGPGWELPEKKEEPKLEPELRHGGVYGQQIYVKVASWIKGDKQDSYILHRDGLLTNLDEGYVAHRFEGQKEDSNIFDDLVALQVDVERVEISDVRGTLAFMGSLTKNNTVEIAVWNRFGEFSTDQTKGIIKGLRQMLATAKRIQFKKGEHNV